MKLKKFTALLIAVTVLATLLCACGKKDGDKDADGKADGRITLYAPDSEVMYLEGTEMEFDGKAEDIIGLLIEKGAMPDGCAANSISYNNGIIYVDMNKTYADYISMGSAAEWFGLGSLVNSLLSYYDGAEKVRVTADGSNLVTEHGGVFDRPLGFFDEADRD